MKFALFTLPLLGLAAAREMSIKQRQLQPILDTLKGISGNVNDLDTAIAAYNGGSPQPIIDGSKKIIAATAAGTETITGLTPVDLNEAVKIQNMVRTMTTAIQKTIGDLVAKKQMASDKNLGGVTYDQLQDQYKGADAIAKAITAKVPVNLQAAATELSKGILQAIQKGVDAFADIKTQVAPPEVQAMVAGGAAGGAAAGGMAAMTTGAPSAKVTGSSTAPAAAAATTAAPAGGNATAGAAGLKPAGALAGIALLALAL